MEIKIVKTYSQKLILNNLIKIILSEDFLNFPEIESQIAYKTTIANSEKDLLDARHLELTFKNLNKERIKYFRELFLKEFA